MRVDWGETLNTNVPVQCYWESVVIFATWGRSLTTLTTYLPVDIWDKIILLLSIGENLHTVDISYLVLST